MRASFIQAWLALRASYYFIPGLMCVAAVLLAFTMTRIDLAFQDQITEMLGWFYAGTVEGSKNILSVIAGSMISVAAVTFSLTMVAVTTASGQYGPRLISNFMRDRANQICLGMFLATFLYCLMVLRTVTAARTGANDNLMGLNPSLSVLTAMLLTGVSVAVLVFFVHHIPETLNVGKLTAKVARQLTKQIRDGVFPHGAGIDTVDVSRMGDPFDSKECRTLRAPESGFVQAVSLSGLLDWAKEHRVRVRLRCVPGEFLVEGDPLMDVIADDGAADDVLRESKESGNKSLQTFIAQGDERTAHQNLLFLADELVEIAARALSPGVNDPFTAINCLHWFETSCSAMMNREEQPDCLADDAGTPRLWAQSVGFERLLGCFFGQSRQYVAADTNAARCSLSMLHNLRQRAPDRHKPAVDAEIKKLQTAIRESGLAPAQVERLMGTPPYGY